MNRAQAGGKTYPLESKLDSLKDGGLFGLAQGIVYAMQIQRITYKNRVYLPINQKIIHIFTAQVIIQTCWESLYFVDKYQVKILTIFESNELSQLGDLTW